VRTILYLKVSVSDFLTLFSSRTKGPFWERPVGKYLSIAAAAALTCSTLLALFWDDIFFSLQGAYMSGLRYSRGAVLATWAYCILWWFVQDAVKIASYHVWRTYIAPEPVSVIERMASIVIERQASLRHEARAPVKVSVHH
jgi:H+-transporting ATPase